MVIYNIKCIDISAVKKTFYLNKLNAGGTK